MWGCNSELARAAESHVFLVSTTYEDIAPNFMVSAIFDLTGKTTALAKEWGTDAVAEVDLDQTTEWPSLWRFQGEDSPPPTARST